MNDIQPRKTEEALRRYVQRLENLHEMDLAILSGLPGEIFAKATMFSLRELIPCQRASVVLLESNSQLTCYVNADVDEKVAGDSRLSLGVSGPVTAFDPAEAVRKRQSCLVPDLAALPERSRLFECRLREGIRCYAGIPLLVETDLIGALVLESSVPAAITSEHLEIAQELANQLAIGIHQDQMRKEIRRQQAELEQRVAERTAQLQETNAELEAFAYSVSHDLRAPLRAMQGFSQALLEDYGQNLDAAGQDYARRIVSAAHDMDVLIQDLLAYSRLSRQELHLKAVDLATVLAAAQAQLATAIQESRAQIILEGPWPSVCGHHATLVQVLANLLGNALKFVKAGVPPQVRLWTEQTNQGVKLWIEDNGIGIAPEHQERIFRIFERLHGVETYPGTGIGLAIARKGLHRLGGRIGVESQPGRGSRFWIELGRQGRLGISP